MPTKTKAEKVAEAAAAEEARRAALTPEEREAEDAAQADKAAAKAPKSAKKVKGTDGKVVVEFIDPQVGLTTREFSEAIHGEDYESVAAQFVETHQEKGAKVVGE